MVVSRARLVEVAAALAVTLALLLFGPGLAILVILAVLALAVLALSAAVQRLRRR